MHPTRPHEQHGCEKVVMAGINGAAEISKTRPVLTCRHHVPVVLKSSLLVLSGYMISATAWLMPAATWPATRVRPRPPFAKRNECTARSALVHGRSSLAPHTGSSRAFMFRNGVIAVGPVGAAVKEQEQEMQEPPLWLGLDLSTQSLTAAVLRGKGAGGASNDPVVLESVNFERDLPAEHRYGSKNGMKVSGSQVTSPVAMWLHALEALLQRLKDPQGNMSRAGFELSAVRAVSVSGQQHGTVYWAKGARERLRAMAEDADPDSSAWLGGKSDRGSRGGGGDSGRGGDIGGGTGATAASKGAVGEGGAAAPAGGGLVGAFSGCFAVEDSPIWADGSTEKYAAELEEAMGGAARLAELTGSRAHLRQGAPQIMKIHQEWPQAYEDTERVSLVCSFLASVLAGRYAEIETSDGSGMNLMHIREKRWLEEALEATAPGLRRRLGDDEGIVDSHIGVGNVSGYLCRRFGFSRDCLVVAGSGDNCNSLAGMGVVAAGGSEGGEGTGGGDVMVSLGTSDTLLGVTVDPSPTTTGNTMYHPCDPAAWFAMLVYKNGSLTREGVRDRRARGSWEAFSMLLGDGEAGNRGKLGLFLDMFEITPQINRQGNFFVDGDGRRTTQEELSAEEETRAVVEGRFLSMRAHARELGVRQPSRILATGGGSKNAEVLQVLADVFQAPVFTAAASDSAAVGAALRAKHGMECRERGVAYVPFVEVYGATAVGGEPAAVPRPEAEQVYASMVDRMDALERMVMAARAVDDEEGDVEGGGDMRGTMSVAPLTG